MANKTERAINSIKMFAIDMINKAGSGHSGIVLGTTPVLYSLYTNILNISPGNPTWINRDRFVLSPGHGSAMLYSMLYFAGYNYSLEDMKRFRAIDSFTPGHPELNPELGIEVTTGALGQGVANAVGMALAEKYLENYCKSIDRKSKLIDYYTYVLVSDGDLQEGISYEALSFAATQKLSKLIVIYDANQVQLDGEVSNTFVEDIEARFEALDFDIEYVKNGNNVNEVTNAINRVKKSTMPSLIIVNTEIGKDTENAGTSKAHAYMLSDDEIKNLKTKYKLPLEPFEYDETIFKYVSDEIASRMTKKYEKWQIEYNKAKESGNKDIIKMLELLEKGELNVDFDSTKYQINDKYNEEGRLSNHKVMNFIAPKSNFFLGGSADLATSTKTVIDKSGLLTDENPTGKNISYGLREHAMAAISNGIALSGIRVFASTYLTFSDYLKPSMRLSAMMNLPVAYIFTHDSVSIGGDGATHEPCEQLTMLRSIPGNIVFRPADINEIMGAWEYFIKTKGPMSLVLSKEKFPILKHTNGKYVKYGAYIVRKEKYHLDGILVATGSEVHTALKVADELFGEGIDLRVVSMPSMELFLKQNPVYEEKLLPKDVKIVTIEAGSTMLWHRFASGKDYAIGIDSFGSSGSKEDVLKFMNFDYNSILIKVKHLMEKK